MLGFKLNHVSKRRPKTSKFAWVGYWKYRQVNSSALTSWRRHQMETFSALLALYTGNSLVTGEFPAQRPVTRSLDVFFPLRQNKQLSEQSWGWWFETPSPSLWRQCNVDLSWNSNQINGVSCNEMHLEMLSLTCKSFCSLHTKTSKLD